MPKFSSEKVFVLFFLNLFLFPIYPSNLKPTLIVLLLIATIFYAMQHKLKFNFKLNKQNQLFYINTSLFFILCISLIYSKNLSSGYSIIFRMMPLLIFPLIFKLVYKTEVFSEQLILKGYKMFYLATIILFLTVFLFFYFNGDVTVNFLRNYNERINTKLGRYSLHPIYGSMYVSIALILSTTLYNKKLLNRGLIIVFNILLTVNLILLARKSAVLIMFVLFIVYLLRLRNIKVIYKIVSILSLILIAIAIVIFVPDISYRFKEFIDVFSASKDRGSISTRLSIFKCSYNAILESPIIGYGVGSVKEVLKQCYITIPEVFNGNYYNSHNQYMHVWLSSGLLGVLSLITMFSYNFIRAIKLRNYIFVVVLILFCCIMFIESMLQRQDGVLLFSLFVNLFAFQGLRGGISKKE